MSEMEREIREAGAKDLHKEKERMEEQIRSEIEREMPHLTPEGREAIIRSRLSILDTTRPSLVKVDLGKDAGKKSKDELFE
jgi:hypothetical protein